jgi:hypothetical protein
VTDLILQLCQAISGNSTLQERCVIRVVLSFTKTNCSPAVLEALYRLNLLTQLTIRSSFDDSSNLRIVFPRLTVMKMRFVRKHTDPDFVPVHFDLHDHQTLSWLTVCGMGSNSVISSPFFHSLFEGLRANTTLENLDLEGVDIDEKLARIMFSALEENQYLSKLNIHLRETEVSKPFEVIEQYLESNCGRLEWLKICGRAGVLENPVSFFESLAVNYHLKFLWIDEVEHSEQISTEIFKEKFQTNNSLVHVRFIGEEWEEIFFQWATVLGRDQIFALFQVPAPLQ